MTTKQGDDIGEAGDELGGTPTKAEKAILERLLFNEQDFLSKLEETINRALGFFQIEPRTGRVILSDVGKRLRVRDQIRVLLAGKHFAWRLGQTESDRMNYKEIAAELNRTPGGISTELSDFVRDGDLTRHEDGSVSMPFHRIEPILKELEQSRSPVGVESGSAKEAPKRNGVRRIARARTDPVLQAMLERAVDLSEYAWVKNLKTARDKGLAALLISKDAYNVDELTSRQMATLLSRNFPVKVTQGATSMGMTGIRGEHVAPVVRGSEIAYSLLPLGREYLQRTASDAKAPTPQGGGLPAPEGGDAQQS